MVQDQVLPPVAVLCCDLRVPSEEIMLKLGLPANFSPGQAAFLPDGDFVSFWQEKYGNRAFFSFPHKDCHWHGGGSRGIDHGLIMAVYARSHGIPSLCVAVNDGKPYDIVYNGLAGTEYEGLIDPVERLRYDQSIDWNFDLRRRARALVVGHHHARMADRDVLRVGSKFFVPENMERFVPIADTFRASDTLELFFSHEVSVSRRREIVELLDESHIPIVQWN
jgi:hypothetical protein